MFGRKHEPKAVIESSRRLGPFELHNPDPAIWLPVQVAFPTAAGQSFLEWANGQAAALAMSNPVISAKESLGFVLRVADEPRHRMPDHDLYWALLKAEVPGESLSVTVVFDLVPAGPGVAQGIEQRLVAGSDAELERHSEHYHEQATGPGRVADVRAVGLGRGRCVVRRDRHQVFETPLEKVMDAEERARYRDPAYWNEAISVHWIFDTSQGVLRASVRTDQRDVLVWAMPRIQRLLDGVTSAGHPVASGVSSNEALEALVYDEVAGSAADEQAVVSRHRWHR